MPLSAHTMIPSLPDIPWPQEDEALSSAAVDAVDKLLASNPKLRWDFDSLKASPLFSGIDWTNLRGTKAPFIPQPDDAMDTTYFEGGRICVCY